MLNKVMLIGRLGQDPEVKFTPQGDQVTTFSLATDDTYKDSRGDKTTKTEWHNIVTWRKLAEICGNFLKKGSLILIEGKIQTDKWEDKEGNKRSTVKIVASQMKMLGKKDSEQAPTVPDQGNVPAFSDIPSTPIDDDTDVPF